MSSGRLNLFVSLTQRKTKGVLVVLLLGVVGLVLLALLPGLSWSAHCHHFLKKSLAKTQVQLAKWRGLSPQLASITGKINIAGASVEVLDSPSGWATLSDSEGKFLLPEEMCYPGAKLELVITQQTLGSRKFQVTLPVSMTDQGAFNLGSLSFEQGQQVGSSKILGMNSASYLAFDQENAAFYKGLFEKLTAGKNSHEEKINSIQSFVAAKLNFEEATSIYTSPRQILERGSKFCGPLSLAMATLAEAGNYPARILHLRTAGPTPNFHAVVEIFYDNAWHVYDATYGIKFQCDSGKVASYQEINLNPNLVKPDVLKEVSPIARRSAFAWAPTPSDSVYVFLVEPRDFDGVANWMPALYASGMHHMFYLKH